MGTLDIIRTEHNFESIVQWLIRNIGPMQMVDRNRKYGQGWYAEQTPNRIIITIQDDIKLAKFKKKWL